MKPYFSDDWTTLYVADVLDGLAQLPDGSVHCCVTSPPYWGLRDYGTDGQLGLEPTPEAYVENMVKVFREVRRVLRDDGTCFLNLGDSYNSGLGAKGQADGGVMLGNANRPIAPGLKPKDLCGIPWRVAFALQADGWWLRSDIIWAKPNPMPESVTDRPTKAHEYIFLLTKSARYFYDADAVAEPVAEFLSTTGKPVPRRKYGGVMPSEARGGVYHMGQQSGQAPTPDAEKAGRNRRTVWTIATKPYPEAHFAVFPPELPEICIKAGTSEKGCCPECGAPWERTWEHGRVVSTGGGEGRELSGVCSVNNRGDSNVGKFTAREHKTTGWQPTCEHEAKPEPCTVLDPFAGAGTTLMVALRLGRDAIGIELSPTYAEMARQRIDRDCPLFNREGEFVAVGGTSHG